MHTSFSMSICMLLGMAATLTAQELPFGRPATVQKHDFLIQIRNVTKNKEFAKQVEIVDSQRDELAATYAKFRSEREIIDINVQKAIQAATSNSELPSKEVIAKIKEDRDKKILALAEKSIAEIGEVLLPHQITRINQLSLQHALRRETKGSGFAMLAGLSERLDLSNSEAKEFKTGLSKLRKEFDKKLAELNEEYEEKALDLLPKHAKEKLEELIGDLHHFRK